MRALLPLLAVSATLGAAAPAVAAPPDVFLVVFDTMRADHAGFHGYSRPTTPNLDRLAKQATVFDQAYACAHWTLPSMGCIFSGLYVHNHKISFVPVKAPQAMPPEVTTMAEAFKAKGYATALYTSWSIIVDRGEMTEGFDDVRIVQEDRVDQLATQFLDEHEGQPRFVVLYYLDPHAPYEPGDAYRTWVPDGAPPLNLAHNDEHVANHQDEGWIHMDRVDKGQVTLTNAQWAQLQAQYDGEILEQDAYFGRFWKDVEQRGLADDSVLVFLSDHGEAFGAHELQRTDHARPYDEILHVPFFIRAPGKLPTQRVATPVRTMDLAATLTDLVGLTFPDPLDSVSLKPVVQGSETGPRSIGGFSSTNCATEFWRNDRYKYIRCRKGPKSDLVEVYDWKADPGETKNLAPSKPELVAKLQAELAAWVQASTKDVVKSQGEASDADLEALKALGYVE